MKHLCERPCTMFRLRLTPILGALILVFLAGCSTTRLPAPSEAIADLTANAKVAVVHYDPEQFMIWTGEPKTRTTALSMFGLIGAAIEGGMQQTDAKEVGAKFISSTQLLDPITQVENRFVAAWQRELKLTAVGTSHLVKNDSSQKLRQQFGEGYVIDFKTERWSVDPIIVGGFSFETITYRPSYTGRARLIRLPASRLQPSGHGWSSNWSGPSPCGRSRRPRCASPPTCGCCFHAVRCRAFSKRQRSSVRQP